MSSGYDTDLQGVLDAIESQHSIDAEIVNHRFWDMFIVDALIGNFNRHNGNWGFLYNGYEDSMQLAPVFDCGSCLYPQTDEVLMQVVLHNVGEINTRVYNRPTSALKQNGRRINYYAYLLSTENTDCITALTRIYPRIDIGRIARLIDGIEILSGLQQQFYKTMLQERYRLILTPAYNRTQEGAILCSDVLDRRDI